MKVAGNLLKFLCFPIFFFGIYSAIYISTKPFGREDGNMILLGITLLTLVIVGFVWVMGEKLEQTRPK